MTLPPDPGIVPSRVLMTADAVGGIWRYSVDLAHALSRAGIEVVLAVMGPPPTPAQVGEVRSNGIVLVQGPFDLEWMPGAADDVVRAGAWLMELERAYAPDLVHLNGYAHAAVFRAPVVVVAHSCVLSWWRAVKGEDAPAEWHHYRRRTGAGLRAADLVVAPTTAFLRTIETIYGRLPQTQVIYNGRAAAPAGAAAKQPLIFTAGRLWDEAKNVRMLVDVAPRLSWPVCIAGDGGNDANAGSGGNVRWLGQLASTDMDAWYAQASIFALPARYEPFGLAVLEAALAGCALVLGETDTLRELWDEAAVFVSPDDADLLADTLEALANAPHRRAALADAARRRAASFPVAGMVDAYLDAYRSVLGSRNAAAPAVAS